MSSSRTVHCSDAIAWLRSESIPAESSFIASLPDFSEFPTLSLAEWESWFVDAAALILEKTPVSGLTIFYQSDIKHEGLWVDKGRLCERAAERVGSSLLWHKIVCRVVPGHVTYGRPSYSHLLCYSKGVRLDPKDATPDVLPAANDSVWARGMSVKAALIACREIRKSARSLTVVNPFCGQGNALAAANFLGMHAIGIERSPKRAEKARLLELSESDI